jgi:hypothetical protein
MSQVADDDLLIPDLGRDVLLSTGLRNVPAKYNPPTRAPAMTQSRVAIFCDWLDTLSDTELRELHRTPKWSYLCARIKFRDDEPVPVECIDLALELDLLYPLPTEYYRRRALLAGRLSTSSIPFTTS